MAGVEAVALALTAVWTGPVTPPGLFMRNLGRRGSRDAGQFLSFFLKRNLFIFGRAGC